MRETISSSGEDEAEGPLLLRFRARNLGDTAHIRRSAVALCPEKPRENSALMKIRSTHRRHYAASAVHRWRSRHMKPEDDDQLSPGMPTF